MAIRSKANFSGLYIDPSGTYADNATGDISAADLRAGIKDFFDSETNFWPQDTSGIVASDSVSGLVGVDFASGLSAPAWREGRVFYDSFNHCFASYNDISDSTLQIGQETYVRIINQTASQIDDGTVVEVVSAGNSLPSIQPALAQPGVETKVIGFATHDIAAGAQGFVTVQGMIHDINTVAFSVGDTLYLSPTTSGSVTNVPPAAPTPAIMVGYVVVDHASLGRILTHIECSHTIEELANVNGTTAQEGYLLGYKNASGYWDATDRINTSGGFKFGDVDGGNYSEFQEDTGFHFAYGSGVGWDDLRFPATPAIVGFFGADYEPDFDTTNCGLLFPQNDPTEIAYVIAQFPHKRVLGSNIRPHVHFIQSQATLPTWKIDYRWYKNGDPVPSFTTLTASGVIFPYTSGSILQIASFPEIDGSSINSISSVMDIKIYRDDNDVTGDVLLKEFDIHYQIDSYGSRQEYIK